MRNEAQGRRVRKRRTPGGLRGLRGVRMQSRATSGGGGAEGGLTPSPDFPTFAVTAARWREHVPPDRHSSGVDDYELGKAAG